MLSRVPEEFQELLVDIANPQSIPGFVKVKEVLRDDGAATASAAPVSLCSF